MTHNIRTDIQISEESHTGLRLFIPYCAAQGCHWIGHQHASRDPAQAEGRDHLDMIQSSRLIERQRQALPPEAAA